MAQIDVAAFTGRLYSRKNYQRHNRGTEIIKKGDKRHAKRL